MRLVSRNVLREKIKYELRHGTRNEELKLNYDKP
jgi:hypothetical protein